MDLRETFFRV